MPQGPVRAVVALDRNPAHLLVARVDHLLAIAVRSPSRGLSNPRIRGTALSLPIADPALGPGGREGVAFENLPGVVRDTREYHQTQPFPSSGEAVSFSRGLERDHQRRLDPGDYRERLLTSFRGSSSNLSMPSRDTSPNSGSQTHSTVDRGPVPLTQGSHRGGGSRHLGEGGGGGSTSTTSWRPRKRAVSIPFSTSEG